MLVSLCNFRHIYWTDWGQKAKIERADLNGENRATIIDEDLVWPNGIAKDGRCR